METYEEAEALWGGPTLTLKITKSDLDPEAVTRRLRLTPTASAGPGFDPYAPLSGSDGRWFLDSDTSGRASQFTTAAGDLLVRLTAASAAIRDLVDEGYSVQLIVRGYSGPRSTALVAPEVLRRIADLGLPLVVVPSTNER
ncbi:DUF4279 domain-containing protein [Polymorphospora sp. NPDC051019]|uniref:DUF4279 domain-containing protein n=1 Tax=Polymorphospora sp. NPDC051019 TaxID=3155725 RepID=UPI00342EED23